MAEADDPLIADSVSARHIGVCGMRNGISITLGEADRHRLEAIAAHRAASGSCCCATGPGRRRPENDVFRSVVEPQSAINRFVAEHNDSPKPLIGQADPDAIIAARRGGLQALDPLRQHGSPLRRSDRGGLKIRRPGAMLAAGCGVVNVEGSLMSSPVFAINSDDLSIGSDDARAAATPHAETYQSNEPYNHICFDDFLPEEVLRRVKAELDELPETEDSFNRAQERLKTSYNPDRLPFYTRSLFHAFNSRPFIVFLEELTGIKGLIPDPYFAGAGIHQVANGGHLDIHADFNHHRPLNLERRLNVLIYLNDDWREEWGGSFEVWDKQVTKKVASFVPIFNRMVCFSTGSDTFHGNPEPVNHPDGKPRRSIALYYYTATWNPGRKAHTTLFKPRPGTADEIDRQTQRQEFLENWLPPAVYRRVYHRLARLGI